MNKELLKENREHGDISFPLNVYYMEVSCNDILFDCHWHEELEFLMVTSGKAVFQIDSVCYSVSAGECFFVNSGELHAGSTLEGSHCTFKAIVFSDSLLQNGSFDLIQTKYMDPVLKNRFQIKRHISGAEDWERELLKRLSGTMDYVIDRVPAYELLVKSELYAIIALIVVNSKPIHAADSSGSGNYRIEKLKKALKFIQDNYSRKLSTTDISTYLDISEGHFCRLFKQYFKKTPVEYLNYYRVNKAARLLKDTELKVLDVAMEVGFDNLSYFIGMFRHYMGTTPSKYRKSGL